MTMPLRESLNNHALVALAALALEYKEQDEDTVHLSLTREEVDEVARAQVRLWRDDANGGLDIVVYFEPVN